MREKLVRQAETDVVRGACSITFYGNLQSGIPSVSVQWKPCPSARLSECHSSAQTAHVAGPQQTAVGVSLYYQAASDVDLPLVLCGIPSIETQTEMRCFAPPPPLNNPLTAHQFKPEQSLGSTYLLTHLSLEAPVFSLLLLLVMAVGHHRGSTG